MSATTHTMLLSDTASDSTPLLMPLSSLPLRENVDTSDSHGYTTFLRNTTIRKTMHQTGLT